MANNNLVTQITIRAGVEGINDINRLADAIEEAGGDVGQLRQSARDLQNAWRNLSTDEQTRQLQNLSDEAERLRNIANARMTLGLDVDDRIRQEISDITQAYHQLRNSGTLSTTELGRATQAYHQRLQILESQLDQATNAQRELASSSESVKQVFHGLQGLMAGLGLTVGLSEIVQMSDEFNNLEARIKLATGEGLNFTNAMASIRQIADETQLPLTSTGELFSKLTGATKDLGLAQSEVLNITKTINQAMAVSGGSAESMDAAITQLAQGLSAGALRGDEFNSVVEQSPRLAAAMADGLGVTIGKLREMAGEGKLTAEVVIGALKSQSETIAKEFAQMPNTVSGSLTVLKNTVLGFVGDLDNQLNSSSGLAGFINSISDGIKNIDPANIEALKNALGSLGEIAHVLWTQLALTVENAQDLIDVFAGVSSANEQVSFLTRTVQGLAIATGTVADGFKAIQIVVQTVMGFVTEEVGKVVYAFSLITGKGSELANNLMNKGQEMLASAEQNALNFSSSAKAALDDAAKTNQQRLQETADKARQAYEAMANDGKASSDKLQSAFADYAQKAIQANQGVIDETLKRQLAEHKLQAVIDQTGKVTINSLAVQSNALSTTTQELDKYKDSFKTLGLDMGVFAGGLPSKIKETVDAFSDIGKVAGANVKQLAIAYQAATTAIGDNKAGQKALNTALVKAVGNSQVLAEKIKTLANEQKYATTNTQEQQKALDALGVSMSAINSQMSTSGQKMANNLKIGLVAIKEQAKGANELKAALNQALDTSIKAAQTKADFEAIKKAIIDAGLSAQVSSEQMNKINTGATGGAKAVAELSEKTTKYSSTVSDNSKKTDENTTATQRNIIAKKELKDANQQAAQSTNTLSEGSLRMAQGLAGLVSKVKQGTQELTKFGVSSEDAAKAASNIHNRIIGSHVNGFDDFLRRLKLSQNEIRQQVENFKEARSAALAMTEALSKPTAGVRELAAAQKVLERATNATVGEIKLMDKATLKGLQSQIKQVEERMRSLSDSAKQTVQDLQSELAELQGNETEVLRIKHAQKLAQLEQKTLEARAQGNQEAIAYYQKAMELQQQINAEENRQASTKASQSATQANTKDITFETHQNPASELSAKDIGDMWAKHLDGIKQEAKREARAEFIQEMQDDIKRRAR